MLVRIISFVAICYAQTRVVYSYIVSFVVQVFDSILFVRIEKLFIFIRIFNNSKFFIMFLYKFKMNLSQLFYMQNNWNIFSWVVFNFIGKALEIFYAKIYLFIIISTLRFFFLNSINLYSNGII